MSGVPPTTTPGGHPCKQRRRRDRTDDPLSEQDREKQDQASKWRIYRTREEQEARWPLLVTVCIDELILLHTDKVQKKQQQEEAASADTETETGKVRASSTSSRSIIPGDLPNFFLQFYATSEPPISWIDYSLRFQSTHLQMADHSSWVIALNLLDRVMFCFPQLTITHYSVHRLWCVLLMIASKMNDDFFWSNQLWSKVGGVRLRDLNRMEYTLLFEVLWKEDGPTTTTNDNNKTAADQAASGEPLPLESIMRPASKCVVSSEVFEMYSSRLRLKFNESVENLVCAYGMALWPSYVRSVLCGYECDVDPLPHPPFEDETTHHPRKDVQFTYVLACERVLPPSPSSSLSTASSSSSSPQLSPQTATSRGEGGGGGSKLSADAKPFVPEKNANTTLEHHQQKQPRQQATLDFSTLRRRPRPWHSHKDTVAAVCQRLPPLPASPLGLTAQSAVPLSVTASPSAVPQPPSQRKRQVTSPRKHLKQKSSTTWANGRSGGYNLRSGECENVGRRYNIDDAPSLSYSSTSVASCPYSSAAVAKWGTNKVRRRPPQEQDGPKGKSCHLKCPVPLHP